MLVLLPIMSFSLLVAVVRRSESDWRRSVLFATVPWAFFLVVVTECLSVIHLVTKIGVSLAWLLFSAAILTWLLKMERSPIDRHRVEEHSATDAALEKPDRFVVYFIVLIAALVGLTALLSAPNTWDSMEYHMPRVVEWMTNRGVQLYPTIDHQQLSMPPMAEYTILHLQLLYGGDRLANLVQWFAYLGSILGATLIVEELGGDRRAQIFSAVLAATLPTAILGASGTKNDQMLAYWITLSVYFLVRWSAYQDWPETLALGATLSLAVFTKGTGYTFLPPLVVACMLMWDKIAIRQFAVRLPIFALLLLALSAPLWVRSYQFSGSIFGPPYFPGAGSEEIRMIRNAQVTPALVVANAARNIALDVAVPSERINAFSTRAFSGLIRAVGADPNDHGQIVVGQSGQFHPFAVEAFSLLETQSSNPIHTLLFFSAGAIYLANFRKMRHRIGWLGVGIIGAFFLYAALVRWSPWNARYQLPLFALSAAFIGAILPRTLPRAVILGISYLLLLLALPFVLRNETRPLLSRSAMDSIVTMPRDDTYFLDQHRSYASSFIAAAGKVSKEECRSIALDANLMHFDYPMFALLSKDETPRRLTYASVHNTTERYRSATEQRPCAVICLECAQATEKWREYSDSEPNPSVFGNIVVFRYPRGLAERP
jgi:4-amino-4-deoxy-L-arabinose transferase-like glycosyltransferase